MTDNERLIALKAGFAGYALSSCVALGSLFLAERQTRVRVKKFNSMTAMLNDFIVFVNNKPVEMSGEEFIDKACEQLSFIGIAGNQMVDGGD